MAAKKNVPRLTQAEVQQTFMKFARLATVWARRSFEGDAPLDRPEDERLLRLLVDALSRHRDVPLIHANVQGRPPTVVRESSAQEYDLYCAVLDAIRRGPDAATGLAGSIQKAFHGLGYKCSPARARVYEDAVYAAEAKGPGVQAGRVLQMAGFRGYTSVMAARKSIAAARAVRARREASTLELIQFFMACLQVPEEDLHGIALAVEEVARGGTLTATPTRWHHRSRLGGPRVPPWSRAYYERYAQANLHDSTRAELGSIVQTDFEEPEDEGV